MKSGDDPLAVVPYMVDDVWLQVLKRLPSDDIVRCRCVCKSWYTLVDSELRNQAKVSLSNSKIPSSISQHIHFPIAPIDGPYFRAVGSVHGIICLLDGSNGSDSIRDEVTLLWSPARCSYIRLPPPPPPPPTTNLYDSDSGKTRLCFTRLTFDPIEKDHLVVRVVYRYQGTMMMGLVADPLVEYYSLRKREWKTVPNVVRILLPPKTTRKRKKKGSIPEEPYIIAESSSSQYRSSTDGTVGWIAWKRWSSSTVLVFSAVQRKLRTLPAMPEETRPRLCPVRSRVVEFRGLLSVIEVTSPKLASHLDFNVWSWFSDQDKWCKMVSLVASFDIGETCLRRINDNDEDVVIGESGLISYDPKTSPRCCQVKNYEPVGDQLQWILWFLYDQRSGRYNKYFL